MSKAFVMFFASFVVVAALTTVRALYGSMMMIVIALVALAVLTPIFMKMWRANMGR